MLKVRITQEHRSSYNVRTCDNNQEFSATVRGLFFENKEFPKVGDYAMCSQASEGKLIIKELLPRTSKITRRAANTEGEQIIAVNVDTIFIVMGLDSDFNEKRLERYLTLSHESNVRSIVILNKKDTVESKARLQEYLKKAKSIIQTEPLFAISATTSSDEELAPLFEYLQESQTITLLGSSGAGKSTLTNRLLKKEIQAVGVVRYTDGRGKHTTIARNLITLPNGSAIIDTPGMRELGIVKNQEREIIETKRAVEKLGQSCQFGNCDHKKSIGCAVLSAIKDGEFSQKQLDTYHALEQEKESQQKTKQERDDRRKGRNKVYKKSNQKKNNKFSKDTY